MFDLPTITVRVVEHRLVSRRCACGTVTQAAAPAGVAAPVSYGPSAATIAVYLVLGQHLPVARTAGLLAEVFGTPMATGTVAAWTARAAAGLAPFTTAARAALTRAELVHADETGLRVAGRLHWLHVACSSGSPRCSAITDAARRPSTPPACCPGSSAPRTFAQHASSVTVPKLSGHAARASRISARRSGDRTARVLLTRRQGGGLNHPDSGDGPPSGAGDRGCPSEGRGRHGRRQERPGVVSVPRPGALSSPRGAHLGHERSRSAAKRRQPPRAINAGQTAFGGVTAGQQPGDR